MSEAIEEVNIKANKIKRSDNVDTDDQTLSKINLISSKISTCDENGKESSLNSSKEGNISVGCSKQIENNLSEGQNSIESNKNSGEYDKESSSNFINSAENKNSEYEKVNNKTDDSLVEKINNKTDDSIVEKVNNKTDNLVVEKVNKKTDDSLVNNKANDSEVENVISKTNNSELTTVADQKTDMDASSKKTKNTADSSLKSGKESLDEVKTVSKSPVVGKTDLAEIGDKLTVDASNSNETVDKSNDAAGSPMDCESGKTLTKVNCDNDSECTESALEGISDESNSSPKKSTLCGNSSLLEPMDVDSNSINSTDAGTSTESGGATELCSKEESASKIKLRSFASLCDSDEKDDIIKKPAKKSQEVSGLSVGDIVQHSNIVEPDQSGVLHLKMADMVGKEECITGVLEDDTLSSLQITSVVSLTEPLSPEEKEDSNGQPLKIANVGSVADSESILESDDSLSQTVIFYKNRLVVATTCIACRKKCLCKFRIFYRPVKPYVKFPYLCSDKCKENFTKILPANHKVEKASKFFDRLCSMCDNLLAKKELVHWQTREFCDKLCLADHIGEVARHCYECKTSVKVLFMGKYCVRFGSDIHQFCSNHCLETYKLKFDSCCYCQNNLENIEQVVSHPPKKYCSLMCVRRSKREDIGQVNYAVQNSCTVCQKLKVNQYEFMNKNEPVLLCSNPCLSVYKYVNQVKAVNCCMCSRFVNAEDFPNYFYTNNHLRVFCSESCLSVFIITARRVVSCQYCKVKKYNFDMIQKGSADTFYCSICCLNLTDNERAKLPVEPVELNSSTDPKAEEEKEPILKICQLCNKNMPAQFHMVMSDSTLRSFCSYNCACKFKTNFGFQVSGVNIPAPNADTIISTTEKTQQAPKKNLKSIASKQTAANKQSAASRVDFQALANILKEFEPAEMANKWTSCKPNTTTVASQCVPTVCNKGMQTDEDGSPPFIPIPFPTFIPTPMMMYSANVPIPLIIPIPIPVPVFIPTTEKTTEDILKRMNKIQNEIPDDPIQAELLLLAKGQEAEMQQELESQITEEDLQTPQMVLEEPDEILTFVDNDEDLSLLDDSIHKFICAVDGEPKKSRKKKRTYDDDLPEPKKSKTGDDVLNAAYGLSVWIDWVRKKNVELKGKVNSRLINEDLVQINSEAINECLSMFLVDLEESQDRVYEIDTIFYLLLGIQKVMFERGSTFCIFLEDRFDKFGNTFDQMITRYLNKQFDSDVMGFQMLNGSRITEDMLWQCRQLGAHTPYVLLNTLFYFSTKCFKLRSVDDHLALSFSQVIKQWRRACLVEGSYTRTTLLKYFPRQAHFDKTELEMHENRIDPLKCPVKLYEFYLSKCPESVRSQQGLYYVYPETCCMPDSPVWFSTGALNANTMERMLHRILLVKEIQEALYH